MSWNVAAYSVCAIVAAGAVVCAALLGHRAVVAQAVVDVGHFRVGSALGEERSGFSGRSKVIVFAGSECLESPAVTAEMDFFVGVIVDPRAEPEVESYLREHEHGVVIRGLQGQVIALLPDSYTCEELVGLLRFVRESSVRGPEPSPIYWNLVERPQEVVDDLLANDRGQDALRYAEMLEEFEGAGSPAVQTVNARLGR